MRKISELISALAEVDHYTNTFNPWRHNDDMDLIDPESNFGPAANRRNRLYSHLRCEDPRIILVGEAPGYQGCHFSGIPFTNEKLLRDGSIPRLEYMQGKRITTRALPWCEPSATIMWRALHENNLATRAVMWNAFAFHPHKPGELYSNRTPTLAELSRGEEILRAVLDLYPGVPVVAVGNAASQSLDSLGVKTAATLRHPANGGATKFREGLKAFASQAR